MNRFICIEGNIGSGKTTLAKALADFNQCKLITEEFEKNPFLPGFYASHDKYALQTEMFFLKQRHQCLKSLQYASDPLIISDFSIYKSYIFSCINLKNTDQTDFAEKFKELTKDLPKPERIVFISNLKEARMERIKRRGRPFESTINEAYLDAIDQGYEEYWQKNSDLEVLRLDISKYNYPYNPGTIKLINELVIR